MRQASRCLHRGLPARVLASSSSWRPAGPTEQTSIRGRTRPLPSVPVRSISFSWRNKATHKGQRLQAQQDSGSEKDDKEGLESSEIPEQSPEEQTPEQRKETEAFYAPWVASVRKLLDNWTFSLFSRRTGTVSEKTEEAEAELEKVASGDGNAWPPVQLRQQARALLDSLTALTKQNRDAAQDDEQPSTSQNDSTPEAVQAALRNGSLGFGFSAGGMLFPYYIGLVKELDRLGIITESTPLAGSSAGSLIAACYHSGMSMDVVAAECFKLSEDCRQNGTRGRLRFVLQRYLVDLLPEDLHERCNGRAFIAVTHALPRPRPELISNFKSREDCISALLTSCHIPFYFDNSMMTTFRGGLCYDGGLTSFIPLPPTQHAVRVCCFPAKQMSKVYHIGISPDTFGDWEAPMSQMLSWAFEPADEEKLTAFIARGAADANAWAHAMGVADMQRPEQQSAAKPDVAAEGADLAVAHAAVPGS